MELWESRNWNLPEEEREARSRAIMYQSMYPDIYYRIQPYVLAMTDQLFSYGNSIPTRNEVEHMSDSICNDLCRLYPDMAEMASSGSFASDSEEAQPVLLPFFGRPIRRRGVFRNLIDILLLNEIFRRLR